MTPAMEPAGSPEAGQEAPAGEASPAVPKRKTHLKAKDEASAVLDEMAAASRLEAAQGTVETVPASTEESATDEVEGVAAVEGVVEKE